MLCEVYFILEYLDLIMNLDYVWSWNCPIVSYRNVLKNYYVVSEIDIDCYVAYWQKPNDSCWLNYKYDIKLTRLYSRDCNPESFIDYRILSCIKSLLPLYLLIPMPRLGAEVNPSWENVTVIYWLVLGDRAEPTPLWSINENVPHLIKSILCHFGS